MTPILLGAVKILLAVQTTSATVAGTVRDATTGEPLAAAVVMLPELRRSVVADANGRYVLHDVPAGPHRITVRFIGYAPRSLRALVPAGGQLEISVSLRPEPIALATLEVTDDRDRAVFPERGSTVGAWENHPLLAEPDVLQALAGGQVVLQPETPNGVHIMGGAADQTGYLLDGIPVFSPYHAGGTFGAWNPDALGSLHLASSAPSPEYPQTLSGTVDAATRAPGAQLRAQGGVSSTHARLTLDGPLGSSGAGFLLSLRSGYPGVGAANREASYMRGETGDRIAKLELPAFGGRVRLLGYHGDNDINTAAVTAADGGGERSPRNLFEWESQSVGAEWRRAYAGFSVRVLSWSATARASSAWAAQVAPVHLASARRDLGFLAAAERTASHSSTVVGLRVERSTTSYRIASDSSVGPSWMLSAWTGVATMFAQHAAAISDRVELKAGASLAAGKGLRFAPRAQLRWQLSGPVALSASYARLHQYAQSLRNAESVVGNVFPADLYVGAGAGVVPVARSDHGILALELRPSAKVSFGAQVYLRRAENILLVAPRDGEPFSTGAFTVGASVSRGASIDASVNGARYAIIASYAMQRVRLDDGAVGYVPDHGATQLFQGGLIAFPTSSSSIRLGVTAGLGRRTTTASGSLEWDACNLVDQGCEFGGSPHYGGERLGGTALPPYLRIDLGLRKHWLFTVAGREALVALFGTVTNVFNRRNVLTYARNPATRELAAMEMRSLAPLVVGLDWRF